MVNFTFKEQDGLTLADSGVIGLVMRLGENTRDDDIAWTCKSCSPSGMMPLMKMWRTTEAEIRSSRPFSEGVLRDLRENRQYKP